MTTRRRGAQASLALVMAVIAGLWSALLGLSHLDGERTIIDRLEASLVDLRFLLAGGRAPPPDVVIVAIDDEAVRAAGSYPLPRAALARLVRAVADLKPKAIALDVLLLEPGGAPDADRALAEALRASPSVLAAAALFERAAAEDGSPLPSASQVLWPTAAVGEGVSVGVVNVAADHAGTPRHVPLVVRTGDDGLLLSLVLRAAALARGVDPVLADGRVSVGATGSGLDLGYHLPLRFYGPRGTIPTLGAARVLRGAAEPADLTGKIVVIGATATGSGDTFATPFDAVTPGVEVLATGIAHLVGGDGLVRDLGVRRLDAAAALVLAVGAVLLLALAPLGLAFVLVGLTLAAWLGVTAAVFALGYWWSAALPLGAVAPPAALCLTARHVLDRRRSQRLARSERALRRFQSPALADRIVRDPGFLAEPVAQDAAILFIDLSGFTRLSEQLGPGRTRDLLKRFHTLVEDEVTAQDGLVVSFMGDGAMIVFGVPAGRADAPLRAVTAALALEARVVDWIAADPDVPAGGLDVRVGGHHGPVVVSRLGSDTHQHITATGDTVNVASRLLAVAASAEARLAISADLMAAARDLLPDGFFDEVRAVEIRGRRQPLLVGLRRRGRAAAGRRELGAQGRREGGDRP